MASRGRQTLKAIARSLETGTWRKLLVSLATWSRHQLGRLILAALVIWLLGSLALFVAERRANPGYRSPYDALWNVWVLLFSGLEDAPETVAGRLVVMLLSIVGVALVGFFTATVASLLVEKYLRRR